MVERGFGLEDILGNVVPGVILVFLVAPVIPAESIVGSLVDTGTFPTGMYVLAMGYVVGRFVNYAGEFVEGSARVARLPFFEGDDGTGLALAPAEAIDRAGDSFVEALENLPGEDGPKVRLNRGVVDALPRELDAKVGYPGPGELEPVETVHLGESILYSKESLYGKYDALTTFFMGLMVLSVVAAVAHAGHALVALCSGSIPVLGSDCPSYVSIWMAKTGGTYPYWLAPPLLVAAAWLSYRQWVKFARKRTRAFFNDLYLELAD